MTSAPPLVLRSTRDPGTKRPLRPRQPPQVSIYCCGVTPYSHTHIGHVRTFFVSDLLARVLQDAGYTAVSARNVTDINDKISAAADRLGVTPEEIAAKFTGEQRELLPRCGIQAPDHEPLVSTSMDAIHELIRVLLAKGHAYVTSTGVYFRVRSFSAYGQLSGNTTDQLRAGARIEVDETKDDPADFALWKGAPEGTPHALPSPWGPGFPGWHIECSAMAQKLFGPQVDIHLGGRDLVFPHHEAEIAQSEAAFGVEFAQVWMHIGLVTWNGEKMSKSTGNLLSLREFLDLYPGEVLRLCFLSASYDQPMDFSLELAGANLKKLSRLQRFRELLQGLGPSPLPPSPTRALGPLLGLVETMRSRLRDDLGSAEALGALFDAVRCVNQALGVQDKGGFGLHKDDLETLNTQWKDVVGFLQSALGIINDTPQEFFAEVARLRGISFSPGPIAERLEARSQARARGDYQQSDRIRAELEAEGILLQDTKAGTTWTVALDS